MTVETIGCDCDEYSEFGIWKNHVLSLLGVYELRNENGDVIHELYKIRDPYGNNVYNGTWSNNDQRWTDSFREQVEMENDDGGVFYVEKENFPIAFRMLSISHYWKDWSNSYAVVEHDSGKPSSFSFDLEKDQKIYLTIDFYYPRIYSYNCADDSEDMSEGHLQIYKGEELILDSEYSYDDDYHMEELELSQGSYTVISTADWEGFNVQDYTVRIYSKDKVDIKKITQLPSQYSLDQ